MPVSIDDVARAAGVSRGTVSHVLNGNVQARIAIATQERVRRAAEELGYHPNRMARSLGRRRTETLGLMLWGLRNPFFVQLMEAVERQAKEAGYEVLLDAEPRPFGTPGRGKLQGWPVDGILMWAFGSQSIEQYLGPQASDIPVVYLSGLPRSDDRDAVFFDVYAGVRAAMEHLVRHGYRRIGFVYPYDWVASHPDEPRFRAYREVCNEAGIPLQLIKMERAEETRAAGFLQGLALAAMPRPARPQAVLCFNDVVAQGVLFGARRAGLRVPDDLAIVGVDGLEDSQYLDVPLTTVHLPADEMCREALRILLQRIKDRQGAPPQQVAIPTKLIVGETA